MNGRPSPVESARWELLDEALSVLRRCRTPAEVAGCACSLAMDACAAGAVSVGLISGETWRPWLRAGREELLQGAGLTIRGPVELAALSPVERAAMESRAAGDGARDRSGADGRAVVCAVRCGGHLLGLLQLCGDAEIDVDLADEFADALGSVLGLVGVLGRADEQRYLLGHLTQRLSGAGERAVELWSVTGADPRRASTLPDARAVPAASAVRNALTARQREVLDLILAGLSNAEIAEQLVISAPTVKSHVRAILRVSGAVNRADAMARLARDPAAPRTGPRLPESRP